MDLSLTIMLGKLKEPKSLQMNEQLTVILSVFNMEIIPQLGKTAMERQRYFISTNMGEIV
jgi:hypothetical protein